MTLLIALLALPVFYVGMRFERWRAHERKVFGGEGADNPGPRRCVLVRVQFEAPVGPACAARA